MTYLEWVQIHSDKVVTRTAGIRKRGGECLMLARFSSGSENDWNVLNDAK